MWLCPMVYFVNRSKKEEFKEINNPDASVGVVVLIRWLQSALIPFVTTQSVRQNYTSVYSFDCKLWLCHNIATAWNNRHPWR